MGLGLRSRGPLAAALILLAAALVAAGCGGSGGGGNDPNARSEFTQSLGPAGIGRLKSGVVDATVKLDLSGNRSGSASVHVTGPFQSGGGSDLTLNASSDFPGLNGSISGEMVATENDLFLVAGGTTYELGRSQYRHLRNLSGPNGPGIAGNWLQQCARSMRAQGLDPAVCNRIHPETWLGDVSDEGSASVAGVDTKHLQAQVDVKKLVTDVFTIGLQAMPPSARSQFPLNPAELGDRATEFVKDLHIDVYRGGDGIPRRIGLTFSVDVGGESADFTVDVSFAHVNEPQTISPPSGPTKPLGDLVAGLPAPFSALYDCITRSSSVQEIQQCSAGVGAGLGGGLTPGAAGVGAGQFVPN